MQKDLHAFRKEIDSLIQKIRKTNTTPPGDQSVGFGSEYDRCKEKCYTHLQEAKMWAGKILEVIGSPFPKELRDEAEVNK